MVHVDRDDGMRPAGSRERCRVLALQASTPRLLDFGRMRSGFKLVDLPDDLRAEMDCSPSSASARFTSAASVKLVRARSTS